MSKKTKFQLTDDRILVRTPKPVEKTEGGIVLPATSSALPKQLRSVVVAAGPGSVMLFQDGRRPLPCKAGDTVVHEFPGHDFDYDGETLKLLREPDVMAVE